MSVFSGLWVLRVKLGFRWRLRQVFGEGFRATTRIVFLPKGFGKGRVSGPNWAIPR
jgi:hypothetical protein